MLNIHSQPESLSHVGDKPNIIAPLLFNLKSFNHRISNHWFVFFIICHITCTK